MQSLSYDTMEEAMSLTREVLSEERTIGRCISQSIESHHCQGLSFLFVQAHQLPICKASTLEKSKYSI